MEPAEDFLAALNKVKDGGQQIANEIGLDSVRLTPLRLAEINLHLPEGLVAMEEQQLVAMLQVAYSRGYLHRLVENEPTH